MLSKKQVITLAVETTYNTSANPTASDAMLVEEVQFSYAETNMIERSPIKATLGKEQSIFGGTLGQVQFTAEIKGSGAAGTAPEIGQALRCVGMAETIVASTSVTYALASESLESCTIDFYQDGKQRRLTGCVGTCSLAGEVGQIGKITFTFTGHVAEENDVAMITPTYDATVPPALIAGAFDVSGFAASISSLSLDLNNAIVFPKDLSSNDGFGQLRITDRDVAGSFDPEQVLIATNDFVQHWKDGTRRSITTGVIGSTAGNRYQLTIPNAYYREMADGERDGILTHEIGFGAWGDDNALSLQFT